MARQLESAWHPERRATISTAYRPSRAFSGSIFGGSSRGTTPDKLYAAVAAATIWPAAPGNSSCNRRDNRVNAWRTVSLMDLGEDPDFNLHQPTNSRPHQIINTTVSLLDLPNSTSDDTSSLSPTTMHLESHQRHHTSMDTQSTAPGIKNTNIKIKLSTNYYQTRSARRAQQHQEIHNLDTGTTTKCKQIAYSSFDEEHNIEKQFLASRNNTNNNQHQNLASSFDPSDKSCTICSTPHNILTSSHPQTKHHSL